MLICKSRRSTETWALEGQVRTLVPKAGPSRLETFAKAREERALNSVDEELNKGRTELTEVQERMNSTKNERNLQKSKAAGTSP